MNSSSSNENIKKRKLEEINSDDIDKLYEKNKCVLFESRKELKEYEEIEYVYKLKYSGSETIQAGDLPLNGVLNEIVFKSIDSSNSQQQHTSLLGIPSTVNKVKNVIFSNNEEEEEEEDRFKIPDSITSISFKSCCSLDKFNLPNSIKELKFDPNWNNEDIPLEINQIPNSVTKLVINNYSTSNLFKNVLSNNSSIKELYITYGGGGDSNNDLFNILPNNLEILYLFLSNNNNLLVNSNFKKCKSIKKLTIQYFNSEIIAPNTLPINITDLELIFIGFRIGKGVIPNNVKNLKLIYLNRNEGEDDKLKDIIPTTVNSLTLNIIIDQISILPKKLTTLEFINTDNYYTFEDLFDMIEILPSSLTCLTLPIEFKLNENEIEFPKNIKNIIYK